MDYWSSHGIHYVACANRINMISTRIRNDYTPTTGLSIVLFCGLIFTNHQLRDYCAGSHRCVSQLNPSDSCSIAINALTCYARSGH